MQTSFSSQFQGLDSGGRRSPLRETTTTFNGAVEQAGMTESKVLLVGEDSLLPAQAGRGCLLGAQRTRIAGKTLALPDALARIQGGGIDVVLLARRFSLEELLQFALEAKRRGYTGVLLQAEASSGSDKGANGRGRRSIRAGDFAIDIEKHRVWVRGEEAQLTPQEFALLTFFCRHPRQLLTHGTLLEAFWGERTAPIEALRVLIQTLRAKIETNVPPQYIVTQYRLGYRFNPSAYPRP